MQDTNLSFQSCDHLRNGAIIFRSKDKFYQIIQIIATITIVYMHVCVCVCVCVYVCVRKRERESERERVREREYLL